MRNASILSNWMVSLDIKHCLFIKVPRDEAQSMVWDKLADLSFMEPTSIPTDILMEMLIF